MRALLVTASKHGSTPQIAEVVADQLRLAGHEVQCRDVEAVADVDILQASAVLVGTATYGARLLSAGTTFADRLEREFAGPVWLFAIGLKNLTRDPLRSTMTRPADGGYRSGRYPIFGGVIDNAGLSMAERALIGALGANNRDLRDDDLVAAWGYAVAEQMSAADQGSSSTLPVV